jgi:hypothetical protein
VIDVLSPINLLCLEQIYRLIVWCQEHPEIQTLLLNLGANKYSDFYDEEAEEVSEERLQIINSQIQKISLLLLNITQSVVVDYGESIDHRDLELGLTADLKIASKHSQLDFDYFKNGLIPGAGGICLLEKLLSPTVVKNWLFGNRPVSSEELKRHGFIFDHYDLSDRDEFVDSLLSHLKTLPPVQRVQAKKSFWEKWSHIWENLLDQESQIFKAALMARDHKEAQKENPRFCEIRELKTRLNEVPDPDLH